MKKGDLLVLWWTQKAHNIGQCVDNGRRFSAGIAYVKHRDQDAGVMVQGVECCGIRDLSVMENGKNY